MAGGSEDWGKLHNLIDKLDNSIREFSSQSTLQTGSLIKLTWAIVVLTILLLIGLVVQIVLVVK